MGSHSASAVPWLCLGCATLRIPNDDRLPHMASGHCAPDGLPPDAAPAQRPHCPGPGRPDRRPSPAGRGGARGATTAAPRRQRRRLARGAGTLIYRHIPSLDNASRALSRGGAGSSSSERGPQSPALWRWPAPALQSPATPGERESLGRGEPWSRAPGVAVPGPAAQDGGWSANQHAVPKWPDCRLAELQILQPWRLGHLSVDGPTVSQGRPASEVAILTRQSRETSFLGE